MTRSVKYSCIRKCEPPPRFCIAIYLPSMAPKKCEKFQRVSNYLAIFKLMGFRKDPDDLKIIARQTSCATCEISPSDVRNGKHGNL